MLKSRHCSLWMWEVPDSYVHSSQEGSLFWTSQQGCLCLTSHVVLSTFLHLLTCPCHNFLSHRSGFYALKNYFLTTAHVYYPPIGSVMLDAMSKIISQRYKDTYFKILLCESVWVLSTLPVVMNLRFHIAPLDWSPTSCKAEVMLVYPISSPTSRFSGK